MSLTLIQDVAIIGGGPTGMAFAKYLLAERAFRKVDVFEQRSKVGGIWNLSGTKQSSNIPVPQTNPRYGTGNDRKSLEFESPLYDYLETNIPKTLMAYSDHPFADSLPLFPGHADVLQYLEEYARPITTMVHFRTQVVSVRPESVHSKISTLQQKWNLIVKDLSTNSTSQKQYDAIVIANGHYTVPHVPEVPGLAEWNMKYPHSVIHSKAYRRPEDFKDKKVLVIGNSASGLDIAAQLAPQAQSPVYLASRSASQLAPAGNGSSWRKDVAEIVEFVADQGSRAVRTKSGAIHEGFDAVIFATGYYYSFPFFSKSAAQPRDMSPTASSTTSSASSSTGMSTPVEDDDSLDRLTTSGLRTHDVYKHFLHIDYPTLVFPVLNLKIIPFPLAENQAAVVARLWSGRLDLPSRTEMESWEKQEERRLIDAKRLRPAPSTAYGEGVIMKDDKSLKYEGGFHTLVYPEDANQINTLYKWAASARKGKNITNDGNGKLGTWWNQEKVWLRGQLPSIKAAYTKLGGQRQEVTSLEALGEEWRFGFDSWKAKTNRHDQEDLFRKAAVYG